MFYSLYKQSESQQESKVGSPVLPWPASFSGEIASPDPANFQLEILGQVESPVPLTLDALQKLSVETQDRRIVSQDGWSYRSQWHGVSIKALLDHVKPQPESKVIRQTNVAEQVEDLMVQDAIEGNALLCFGEKDCPLTTLYGGPLRLLVFDRYLYKGLPQLVRLEFLEEPSPGYWQSKGYSENGEIEPGDYYAFDLGNRKPIRASREVTDY